MISRDLLSYYQISHMNFSKALSFRVVSCFNSSGTNPTSKNSHIIRFISKGSRGSALVTWRKLEGEKDREERG